MRHRNIEVGKIYEIKVRTFTVQVQMWDSVGNPVDGVSYHQIDGYDKNKQYKCIRVEFDYQTALVLEKCSKKLDVMMRCLVGTDDIWLPENAFIQEFTRKRARQLAKSQQKDNQ